MFDKFMQSNYIEVFVVPWGIRLITAILIFVIGRWLAKTIVKFIRNLMLKSKLDEILVKFLGNIAYALLIVIVVLAALEQLGVQTTSALAILGAAGLAVGLSLQSSLSNFAAGVMLVIFRPFNEGDFVEAGGTSGVVETIDIFKTVLRTGDNREVIVPNGQIYGGTIINFSARDTRRIDLVFGIGYDDDIRQSKEIIDAELKKDTRILGDPEPTVMVLELGASSVDLAVRPWVNSADYWGVRSDLLENIKIAFDKAGISIPYPQQDLHIKEVAELKSVS